MPVYDKCQTIEQTLEEQQTEAQNKAILYHDPFYITDDTINFLASQLIAKTAITCQTHNLEVTETYDITLHVDKASVTFMRNASMTCHSTNTATIYNSYTQVIRHNELVPNTALRILNAIEHNNRQEIAFALSLYDERHARCYGRQYVHKCQSVIHDSRYYATHLSTRANRIVATTYRNTMQRIIDTRFILDSTTNINYLHSNLYDNNECFTAALIHGSARVNLFSILLPTIMAVILYVLVRITRDVRSMVAVVARSYASYIHDIEEIKTQR